MCGLYCFLRQVIVRRRRKEAWLSRKERTRRLVSALASVQYLCASLDGNRRCVGAALWVGGARRAAPAATFRLASVLLEPSACEILRTAARVNVTTLDSK